MMTLSARLQALRARSGLSYQAAATAAGLNYTYAFRVFRGVVPNPGFATVEKLVQAMGGTLGDLDATATGVAPEDPAR